MTVDWAEVVARQFEPRTVSDWETPGALAKYLDPRTAQTPALDLIDQACIKVLDEAYRSDRARGPRLIVTIPPQEGKSERLSRRFPLWALLRDPSLRIAIASYESSVARRWGRAIRDDILTNPELGLRISSTLSAQQEWQLAESQGGVYTAGVGGALTGRAVDLMIIDDPVKDREQADSETYRDRVWSWWTDTVLTRLAPGAPVILIMTRWHPDDLAGRLIAEGGWDVLSIPAQSEGIDDDPLGREKGVFLESARGRSRELWESIKRDVSSRTWSALYQQRPIPAEGLVFNRQWIDNHRRMYGPEQHEFVRVVVSIDPAAKKTGKNSSTDETGIVVVALDAAGDAWVLDDRSLRGSPSEWGTAAWTAVLQWRATEVVVEDNQGGDMVEHVLATTWQSVSRSQRAYGIQPAVTRITATASKRVRAESVAALYEVGRVHHASEKITELKALEDQMCSWTGDGKSPDRMDALVHGLRALATPRVQQHETRTRTR